MAVKRVLKMGDPRLLEVSKPVDPDEIPVLKPLVQDMIDTMNSLDGAGIAAPQIGVQKRVVIFEVTKNPRYPEAEEIPFTVLINPEITLLDDEMSDGWEGCLSVPGIRGVVPRYKNVCYRGLDLEGNKIERTVGEFHARVVQHECDHLDGILFPQRVVDMRLFGFEDELTGSSDCGEEV